MSEISTIRGTGVTAADTPGRRAAEHAEPAAPARTPGREDRVELSTHARLLARLAENPIRPDLVADVKAQIESGAYETDDKLERAIDAMLADFNSGGDAT